MSTCPVDHATSVPTEKVHDSMILESVLGVSLQHYGITRDARFTNRIDSVYLTSLTQNAQFCLCIGVAATVR